VTRAPAVLTPLRRSDARQLFAWINDRELVLFNAPYTPVHERQHLKWFDALETRRDAVIFGIRRRAHGRLLGVCQLVSISPVHRAAELQIRIGAPSARDRGLGTSAVRTLVDFAFRDLNLRRVSLHVFATNGRAIRAYEKAGFAREGLLRQAAHIDGSYVDVVVMGILRPDVR
jgi:RimJ/RimL family protein N-acetyltransferase